jgi:hypothetical protein
MNPFVVRAADTKVEVWSAYRIQFGGMERHVYQAVLKAELKEALSGLVMQVGAPFAGYYARYTSHGSRTGRCRCRCRRCEQRARQPRRRIRRSAPHCWVGTDSDPDTAHLHRQRPPPLHLVRRRHLAVPGDRR